MEEVGLEDSGGGGVEVESEACGVGRAGARCRRARGRPCACDGGWVARGLGYSEASRLMFEVIFNVCVIKPRLCASEKVLG